MSLYHSILDDDEQVASHIDDYIDHLRVDRVVYTICKIWIDRQPIDFVQDEIQKEFDWIQTQVAVYKPANSTALFELVRASIICMGNECSLNWIDVSEISTMKGIFQNSKFDGDISKWDTSNVTDMSNMFENSVFNGDISNWDVRKVKNISEMFQGSKFNGDIHKWELINLNRDDWSSTWNAYACCNLRYTNRPGMHPTVVL